RQRLGVRRCSAAFDGVDLAFVRFRERNQVHSRTTVFGQQGNEDLTPKANPFAVACPLGERVGRNTLMKSSPLWSRCLDPLMSFLVLQFAICAKGWEPTTL